MPGIILILFLSLFNSPVTPVEAPAMLFLSETQGEEWYRFDAGLPEGAVVRDIIAEGENLWLATDTRGAYFLPAGKTEWESRSNGLPEDIFATSIAVSGEMVAIGSFNHGIFVSHDAGLHWRRPILNLQSNPVRALHFMNGMIIAGTDRGIFRTFDGGLGWLGEEDDYLQVNDLLEFEGKLFAGRRDGILVSADGGTTWEKAWSGGEVFQLMIDGNKLYAFGRKRLRSTDGGTTWEANESDNVPGSAVENLPEALWHGHQVAMPKNRSMRGIYVTDRGWLVGIGAGC